MCKMEELRFKLLTTKIKHDLRPFRRVIYYYMGDLSILLLLRLMRYHLARTTRQDRDISTDNWNHHRLMTV